MRRESSRHHRHRHEQASSPYAGLLPERAPRYFQGCLFFVNETDQHGHSAGSADGHCQSSARQPRQNVPWKDLDLTAITGQTVEDRHLFDVHLGETIAPYITLKPLKGPAAPEAVRLYHTCTDDNGPGGIRLGGSGT